MQITLLDNKKNIKDLVEVDTHDSILESINKELAKKEYNFVVTTEDDIKKAKKVMADLNKSKDIIDTFRKDKISVESVAIDLFKSNAKEYLALFDAKREEIKKKYEVSERKAKDKILKELSLYSEEFVKLQGIREEFKEVDIADLIIFGSVTPKGKLTGKAKEVIESRVMVCKSKQDKYDMRLMELKNKSYEAGLEAVLTITHVQGIISLDNDAEYQTRLNELISSELDRQNTIKANLQNEATKTANREAQQKVINEQNRIRGIFTFSLGTLEDTDSAIAKLSLIKDFSEYCDYAEFARSFVGEQISKLNFHRNDLLKKANDLLDEMESKEIPIVHETIPSTQNEKQDQVKEVAADRKIVRINAIFEVEVPGHVHSDAVLNKVRSRLSECDINSDTLKSLEVMQ